MRNKAKRSKDHSDSALVNHALGASTTTSPGHQFPLLAAFFPSAIWQWMRSYLSYAFRKRCPFPSADAAPQRSRYSVPDPLTIGLAGDWGTGTDEAFLVAQQVAVSAGNRPVDLTIHIGDVYYVGTEQEIRENCLGGDGTTKNPADCVRWPVGGLGSFALCGNHEMFSNGAAYYNVLLPQMGLRQREGPSGQGCSFFCLENDHWRILGVDTGYNSVGLPVLSLIPGLEADCALPGPVIDWLDGIFFPASGQGAAPKATILMSHHQYFSAFDERYRKPARQLAKYFKEPVIWFWGHEHRLAGYQLYGEDELQVYGRCVGHGGMPNAATDPAKPGMLRGLLGDPHQGPREKLAFYDKRVNPHYAEARVGIDGSLTLKFDGPTLTVTYRSLKWNAATGGYDAQPEEILRETFVCDGSRIGEPSIEKLIRDPGLVVASASQPL